MTDLIMPRRKFLTGLFGLVAAPAVVKAANIMPVKVIELPPPPIGFRRLTPDDYRRYGINLQQMRDLLMPGLNKMVDHMYTEHPGYGKFLLAGGSND